MRNWWLLALRGVLAILFGVVAFLCPGLLWLAVVYTYAAYALVDGIFAIGMVMTGQTRPGYWWALLLEGVVGIAFGVVTFAWPFGAVIDLAVLIYFIAGWLTVTGVLQLISAIRLRRYIKGEWILAIEGIVSILLGVGFALIPGVALWVMALWIGAYSISFGVLLLVLAFRMRGMARHGSSARGTATPSAHRRASGELSGLSMLIEFSGPLGDRRRDPKGIARGAVRSENSALAGPRMTRSRPNRGDTRIVSI